MKKILAVVLTLAMLISAVPVSFGAAELDPDLVAAWNFDSISADNTIVDITGNGNDLIIQDTAYEIVDGFSGKTFDFNGGTSAYDNSKHLVVSSDKLVPFINGSPAVTITAFVKKETKGSSTNFTMFALNAGSNSIMTYARANDIAVSSRSDYKSAAVGTTASNIIYPNADDANAPDSWMHVALILDYENDNVKIYADGVLVGEEQAQDGQKFATDYANYKTDVNDIATGYFGVGGRHVRMDDVKIYKRALTENEIKESIPPVLSYDFEEVCDGKIKDSSAHGMDITVDATDSPEVIEGIHGNTISLNKTAHFPADTFTGMLYGAKEFAVSTWIRFPNGTGAAPTTELHILSDELGTATKAKAFTFTFKGRNGYFGLRSRNSTSSYDGSMAYVQAENVRSMHGETDWHHIYITADFVNKTGEVYWDGVLAKTIKTSSMTNAGLGYFAPTPDGVEDTLNLNTSLPINLDSLKVYRRTLTANEIARESGTPYLFSQTSNSVAVECYPENISGLDVGSQVIIAMYDSTKALRDCDIVSVENINDKISLKLDEIDVPVNYSYKLFMFKSLDSLTPICEEIDYTAQ